MTIKQQLFVRKYLELRNATKAVLEAYDVKNTNSAAVIGCRLLRNVNVRREIDRTIETEGSIPSRIVELIDNVYENGSVREQLKIAQLIFRFYGLL